MDDLLKQSQFEALYELHRREIFWLCYQLLRNQEDAEEVTAETFLAAWRTISSLLSKDPDYRRNSLRLTARRKCYSLMALFRIKLEIPADDIDFPIEPEVRTPTPEEEAIHADLKQKLLQSLTAKEWIVLQMRTLGRTRAEIAAVLDCSPAAVARLELSAIEKFGRLTENE